MVTGRALFGAPVIGGRDEPSCCSPGWTPAATGMYGQYFHSVGSYALRGRKSKCAKSTLTLNYKHSCLQRVVTISYVAMYMAWASPQISRERSDEGQFMVFLSNGDH